LVLAKMRGPGDVNWANRLITEAARSKKIEEKNKRLANA
jgi:hypothetical protein